MLSFLPMKQRRDGEYFFFFSLTAGMTETIQCMRVGGPILATAPVSHHRGPV
jgi:hypothetical protein